MNVISFDIWGTLLRSNPGFSATRAQLVIDYFKLPITGAEFRVFIKEACTELDAATDRTGMQFGFAARVRFALKLYGFKGKVTDQDLAAVYAKARAVQLSSVDNMPTLMEADLPETFRQLVENGFKLAVISNTGMTEGDELTEILDALGLGQYLTYRIYSDKVGMAKPSKTIFQALVSEFGVPLHRVLHVGDNVKADFLGALNAGCHSELYDPDNEHPEVAGRYGAHSQLLKKAAPLQSEAAS